ncbi:hypothetical protein [Oceanobacillus kapialis]|uniref:hypothetical protein n=1 Tax=Oceanobacillus kapialis TaxID=481353 RepID=UPI00384A61BF
MKGIFNAGIPNISLVPVPDYLTAEGENGYLERVDSGFMYEQIGSFIKMVAMIDQTLDLGKVDTYAGILGFLGKAHDKQ